MMTPTPLRSRLKGALTAAMKQRDRDAISLYRTVLAAIDNAEAIEIPADFVPTLDRPNEAPRRILSEEDIRAIVQREANDLHRSAATLDEARRPANAEALRALAARLSDLLGDEAG